MPDSRLRPPANRRLLGKLALMAVAMFGFGYGLVPMYRAICNALGINVLAVGESRSGAEWAGRAAASPRNTQVDTSRTITVIFDANARGPWAFHPERSSLQVHPGQIARVDYDFRNQQDRAVAAQAIPSYAPRQAGPYFHKLECFCFTQHTMAPGESKRWPVVFVVDPDLPRSVTSITLSYTFFEVGAPVAPMPEGSIGAVGTAGRQGPASGRQALS